MKKLYLLFLIVLGAHSLFAQTIRYVTPTGSGTGTGSWANASNDLQAMINASDPNDEVWVAAGTYKPTENIGNTSTGDARDQSFILRTGVKVYGGYASNGSGIRNISANVTILSGDLNNDGAASDGDCYHVVVSKNASNGAVLDGFTIQHGFANGTVDEVDAGNGIERNRGAGVHARGPNTSITYSNLIIKENIAGNHGGGVYLRPSGASTVINFDNVTFEQNKADNSGGALYLYTLSGMPVTNISKTEFHKNEAKVYGAAFYIAGGSITNSNYPVASINNSVFYDNKAIFDSSASGGALYCASFSRTTVVNSVFFQNKSGDARGAVSFNNASSTTLNLYNNIFNGNQGSYLATKISADIRRATDAIQDYKNNIFQASIGTSLPRTVTSPLVSTDATEIFESTDPDDPNFLKLKTGSIALDAGDNSLSTVLVDLANMSRIRNTTIDLGAYEFQVGNYPLPVKLESYTAVKKRSTSVLSWKTASEQNNQKFVIERGASANDFEFFKEVAGAGDSSLPLSYSVTDFAPMDGINYYRLRQVDNDGKSEILGTQVLSFGLSNAKLQVYPNPAKNYIEVKPSPSNRIVSLNLISLTGKNILTNNYAQAVTHESVKLDLANIPTGTYILWVNKGKSNSEKQTLLVVK